MSFTIRPATGNDYEQIAALISAQRNRSVTAEAERQQERYLRPEDPFLRLVATDADENVVGHGVGYANATMRPGHIQMHVRADHAFGGRGIGTGLEARLAEWAAGIGATALEGDVQESDPASCAWAERRGYSREFHLYESSLELAGWDPAPYAGALEQVRARGVRLTTLAAEGAGEDGLRRLYPLVIATHAGIPGWDGRPAPSFELWSKWTKENPHTNPEAIFLAVHGDNWVALSEVHVLGNDRAYNSFTGVQSSHRGQGLALAVKVLALEWAKRQGVPVILTENHSLNAPMLAVNRKLGYTPHPGTFHVQRRLG